MRDCKTNAYHEREMDMDWTHTKKTKMMSALLDKPSGGTHTIAEAKGDHATAGERTQTAPSN